MGADLEAKDRGPKKGGLRRKKHRVTIRIDMTPMVDVAFLLLIFFMVTTVFRQPQAMEMSLPPADTNVQVPQSNVLTLFVNPESQMLYRMGTGKLAGTALKDLHSLFIENSKLNPQLIILVKLNRSARYEDMVDIMDELEIAAMTRFSVIAMTDDDVKLIEAQQ
jgi:biopolymer transport protein ExbD